MLVVGLDVCKSSVVACFVAELPSEPRQFYYDAIYEIFSADAVGIGRLLEIEPDVAVMEPTGTNYQKLWGTHLARTGVQVVLVGHNQLHSYRANHLQLPDKDDQADALALACYYLEYESQPRRFLQIRDKTIVRIRELVLRLQHLNRVQSPIINRLRQDLAWQFPEVASVHSLRCSADVPLLWGWLATERESKKYDKFYKQSVGLGITDDVRLHAKRICDLQREEMKIETELAILISHFRFAGYRKVFAEFRFGQRVEALLLSQIYPIENFLDENNKPIVQFRKGRNSLKPTKRYLSRRRFEKALGVAPTENSSGDKKSKKVVGGSDLCRKALWQWVFTRVEPVRNRRGAVASALGKVLDIEKANGKPVRLVRSRISSMAARMLFKKLVLLE